MPLEAHASDALRLLVPEMACSLQLQRCVETVGGMMVSQEPAACDSEQHGLRLDRLFLPTVGV